MTEGDLIRAELDRWQRRGLGLDLRTAIWVRRAGPNGKRGEVRGDLVLVYATGLKEMKRSLLHEVIHYEIVRTAEPYVAALNGILAEINKKAYRETETLTERLCEVFGEPGPPRTLAARRTSRRATLGQTPTRRSSAFRGRGRPGRPCSAARPR